MKPVVDCAIRTARSLGVVGVMSWIRRRSSAVASRQSESDSSTGRSGTIRPSKPARTASRRKRSAPWRWMIAYEIIATRGVTAAGPSMSSARRVRKVSKMCESLTPPSERPGIAGGDHGAVGDRVGIGDADLDHVGPPTDDLGDDPGGRRKVGVAGRDERHQGRAALAPEAGEQGIDAVHDTLMIQTLERGLSSWSFTDSYDIFRTSTYYTGPV